MYHFTQTGGIVRDSDGAFIPNDPANSDYQTFLVWQADGNSPTAYVAPAPTWQSFQASAQAALDKTDTTVHRVAEAVALGLTTWTTADVVAFMNYRRSLRAIVSAQSGTPGTLPTRPAYPANT